MLTCTEPGEPANIDSRLVRAHYSVSKVESSFEHNLNLEILQTLEGNADFLGLSFMLALCFPFVFLHLHSPPTLESQNILLYPISPPSI